MFQVSSGDFGTYHYGCCHYTVILISPCTVCCAYHSYNNISFTQLIQTSVKKKGKENTEKRYLVLILCDPMLAKPITVF